MTLVHSLAFPSSRTLAGWWRQLAPHEPTCLWFAHLFVHRVEAPIRCRATRKLDPLHRLTLQALDLERQGSDQPSDLLTRLERRLHLPAQAIVQILRTLANEELLSQEATGQWSLTALGAQAKERGEYAGREYGRHVFPFLERVDQRGIRMAAPHFLNIQSAAVGTKWDISDENGFDVSLLHDCLKKQDDWKRRFAFPLEIDEVVDEQTHCKMMPWQRVIVDRPERVAVVLTATGDESLLAFAVQEEGWLLLVSAPLFSLGRGWSELMPAVAQQSDDELWRHAWQELCAARGVSDPQAAACQFTLDATTLRVRAQPDVTQHLRGQRDLSKDGIWTLVGDGLFRPIVRIKLIKSAAS